MTNHDLTGKSFGNQMLHLKRIKPLLRMIKLLVSLVLQKGKELRLFVLQGLLVRLLCSILPD